MPAPVRFLYDFDNLLRSHADRTRVSTEQFHRTFMARSGPTPSAVLVDGTTTADWTLHQGRGGASLTIRPHRPLSDEEADAVADEATGLLDVAVAGHGTVTVLPPPGI